jgi:hypothetical protein
VHAAYNAATQPGQRAQCDCTRRLPCHLCGVCLCGRLGMQCRLQPCSMGCTAAANACRSVDESLPSRALTDLPAFFLGRCGVQRHTNSLSCTRSPMRAPRSRSSGNAGRALHRAAKAGLCIGSRPHRTSMRAAITSRNGSSRWRLTPTRRKPPLLLPRRLQRVLWEAARGASAVAQSAQNAVGIAPGGTDAWRVVRRRMRCGVLYDTCRVRRTRSALRCA